MPKRPKIYIAIDLKSFYASVECRERRLDPLTTNLVVADGARSPKTICLAVSPALKRCGLPGRPRLFEVIHRIRSLNIARRAQAPDRRFIGAAVDTAELSRHPEKAIGYIVTKPRMALYIAYSTEIYKTYLDYVAPEDIHSYSIDEVFIDATTYLRTYGMTPHDFAMHLIHAVLNRTGITATAGIGTNLYLSKIAMDIVAKKTESDAGGVRVAMLDEARYRRLLWDHRPLTDFWRIGQGYAKKLAENQLFTMGDIARVSLLPEGEHLLYKLFGVNAELLIDHAWGYEPCTMADIKRYRPRSHSASVGQVLVQPYPFNRARTVMIEMLEALSMDLLARGALTDQLSLHVGYDIENLKSRTRQIAYQGEVVIDRFGRHLPKPAHGSTHLSAPTAATAPIIEAGIRLFDCIVDAELLIRRITLSAGHIITADAAAERAQPLTQLDFLAESAGSAFPCEPENGPAENMDAEERANRRQAAILEIRQRFGKNAILSGISLTEGATARVRNLQIGGHHA